MLRNKGLSGKELTEFDSLYGPKTSTVLKNSVI